MQYDEELGTNSERPDKIEIIDLMTERPRIGQDHYGACEVCGKPFSDHPLTRCRCCGRWCCLDCQTSGSNGWGGSATYCKESGEYNSKCGDNPKVEPKHITGASIIFELLNNNKGRWAIFSEEAGRLGRWREWQRMYWDEDKEPCYHAAPSAENKAEAKRRFREWSRDVDPAICTVEAEDDVKEAIDKANAKRAAEPLRCPMCGVPLRHGCNCGKGPEHFR